MTPKNQLRNVAKAAMPAPVLKSVRTFRRWVRSFRNLLAKHFVAWKAPILHERLLAENQGVRPIRVLFLISNTASWKVGPVFARMLEDDDFEPIAAVCPVAHGTLSKAASETAGLAIEYLDGLEFPYVDMTLLDADVAKKQIDRINPHLVFFTNPHALPPKHLHDELLLSHLTCYVPYSHEVMEYGDDQEQHNQKSHNAFWRIFVAHEESRKKYDETRLRAKTGVIVTGFPACEALLAPDEATERKPWKAQETPKKKIIYAPHWLWRPDIKMATIDAFGEFMMRLAERYQADVQWALRPHPMLKPRLLESPEWGPQRTEEFFKFWSQSDFSQVHEEDYVPLFRSSDAIIHDSGSFLAEYLYLRKPALYLMTEQTGGKYFNAFGRRAISACDVARRAEEIERFLIALLNDEVSTAPQEGFFKEDIAPHFERPPSLKICDEIKRELA